MKTIVGLYDYLNDAHQVIDALVNAGIDRADISLVASDPKREYGSMFEDDDDIAGDVTVMPDGTLAAAPMDTTADDAAVEGAVAGGVIGGLAGLLLGLGAFAIPGVGPIVAAGPLMAALVGAGVGAASGGLLGALVGWGVPETEAGYYAEGVRRGGTLVAVRTPDNLANRVVEVMNLYNPVDVQRRSADWQTAGWTGFKPDAEPYTAEQIESWRTNAGPGDTGMSQSTMPTGTAASTQATSQPLGQRVRVWPEAGMAAGTTMHDTAREMDIVDSDERYEAGEVWVERVMGERDFESFGPSFHSHYSTTYATTGRPYSEFEPSYRFGYDLAHDERYHGRDWNEIAEDAARDWGSKFDQAWEDVKDNVRHAWNEVKDVLDVDDDGEIIDLDDDSDAPGFRGAVSEDWGGVRRSFRPSGDNPMMNDLHDLLIEQIQDLYSAENQIIQALPKMINATWSNELRTAFQDHLTQTQIHLTRLRQIADSLSQSPQGKECKGMRGLLQEGEETLQKPGPSATKDAALIGAAQRVEHYEVASYGTARTHARELGYDQIADLLQTTLDEEGDADKLLTSIAEGGLFEEGINEMAEKSL